MGMPSINITFQEKAASAVQRGQRGIVALILKQNGFTGANPFVITSAVDTPTELTDENKEQVQLAFMGYLNPPKKVIGYVISTEVEDYTQALTYLQSVKFDYLVVPTVATDKQEQAIVTYVKSERANDKLIKAVLPNTVADSEGIINFATAELKAGEKTYKTEQYCARIAGILAGTPLSISCTYAPMPELTDCTHISKDDMNKAVDEGKLIAFFDGEKVKLGRAVNSFTTTTDVKGASFKKIKIVDAMDMIDSDIRTTVEDNYLGKYANTYDNKCLLLSAISGYFDGLVADNVLSNYTVGIDILANKTYLKSVGKYNEDMTEQEIKEANTGSNVFLQSNLTILDALEDITYNIFL